MRLVVHVGMHKTGTSSIQMSMRALKRDGFLYLPWSAPNHSAMMALMFRDEQRLEHYHLFRKVGTSREELLERRKAWRRKTRRTLQDARDRTGTILISAEDLSHPNHGEIRRNSHAFLTKHHGAIDLIGYVRDPESFLQSIFQQRLQGGKLQGLELETLWPAYRRRFKQFDTLFGRDALTLRLFDRAELSQGNVVVDLAEFCGLEIAPHEIVHRNESLSLEAIALLFVQRVFGGGFPEAAPDAIRRNKAFIQRLAGIGTRRLVFAPTLTQPVIAKHRADLDWMEDRLGMALPIPDKSTDPVIEDQRDLIRIALEAIPEFEAAVGRSIPGRTDGDRLTALAAALDTVLCAMGADG